MKFIFLTFLLPLLSSVFLSIPWKFSERFITRLTTFSILIPTFSTLYLIFEKLPFELELAVIKIAGHKFPLEVWVDHNSVTLLALTHVLGLLVMKFAHGYLHLEKGYQRFFSTILFFIFGMEILSLAGNMDLFFGGWEIVGFSSFLLIAFYRSHSRSVSNALRIYNIYRVCDVGLLIGAVFGHVMWHEATRFSTINTFNPALINGVGQVPFFLLCLCIVFASLGKSAQFPFYNWPARAMEGPTPSSAIFYGALSIHAGVFLLLRTQPLWSTNIMITILIGLLGLITLFLSSIQGRIQTNIKGQIAYASTAQIGVMFIELSLGLSKIVLLHLVCHALYRCFQLLVSPSVVAGSNSLNNKVVYQRILNRKNWLDRLPKRWSDTIYLLGSTEFSFDVSWRGFGFVPWKRAFYLLKSIVGNPVSLLTVLIVAIILKSPSWLGFLGLVFALRSILLHQNPFLAMRDLSIALLILMTSMYLYDPSHADYIKAYMYPVGPFLFIALMICWNFRHYDLRTYQSLGSAHSTQANIFMICFMVLSGMPISTAFIAEDIILEDLFLHSPGLATILSGCLMINGFLCVKIYSRLFMGRPPKKSVI